MGIIDEIEERTGRKVEELNEIEKQTFFEMVSVIEKSQLTPEKFRDYIISMREAVEMDIVKEPAFKRIFIFKVENLKLIKLQARLQNYLLIEAFLVSPSRAKERLIGMVGNIPKK